MHAFICSFVVLMFCGNAASFGLNLANWPNDVGVLKFQNFERTSRIRHSLMSYGFSYKNCGKPNDPIQISRLKLGPDPLKIPGNITLAVDASLSKTLSAPIKVELTVEKKVLIWVKVPCIDNFGSCTYDNVCELLAKIPCPKELKKYGITCKCPFKPGKFNVPTTTVDLEKIPDIPSFLEDGDYKITAVVSQKGVQLGCLYIEVSLK